MRALLASLLFATAVSAGKLTPAPDTLHVHLSHLTGNNHALQVTITNFNSDHAYIHDPSESLSNPQEDTYLFDSEPAPGAARFHGVVRGTIDVVSTNDAASDWDRLQRWKSVALNALRVPANGGVVAFNVTPADHVEFSATGTYTLSMGLTLTTLSSDRSKLLRHHMSTNAVNMTVVAATSTDHNDKLSRRSLAGGDTQCSARHALLVDAWAQQALFSVKDAKTEALGGKFHAKYKDDINFCFGPDLKDLHQKYISDGLEKLAQVLDPKGQTKFAAFCDMAGESAGCQPDTAGNSADSWFTSTSKQIDVTLCGTFFYRASHCAYQYKSTTNSLAGTLVRALQISKSVGTPLFDKLLEDFEGEYKPTAINKALSADQRVKFYPSWECFLSRRSKDETITKDACNADEQASAGPLSASLLADEIFKDAVAFAGAGNTKSSKKKRRLTSATSGPESVELRRRLINAKLIKQLDNTEEGVAVPEMTERDPAKLIGTEWERAAWKRPTIYFVKRLEASNKPIPYKGTSSDSKELRKLVFGKDEVTCDEIRTGIETLSESTRLDPFHNALRGILAEAAGTGVYDLSSDQRQHGRLNTLIDALADLEELSMKLKLSHGIWQAKRGCLFRRFRRAPKVFAALDRKAKFARRASDWTQGEQRATALARATVVTLVGALFHDYDTDYDLSGDEMMNHAIYRLNHVGDSEAVFRVLTRAYDTVLRTANALTIGGKRQTPEQFNELGLDKHFWPKAQGRGLVDALITNIHGYYSGSTGALATIPIPAIVPEEYELMTILLRKKRQEVREMRKTQWQLYKDGIDALMVNGKYADFIFTHAKYFAGKRLHENRRFLPWHRAFLILFDEELTKVLRRPMRAPYWDWTVESDLDEVDRANDFYAFNDPTSRSAIFTDEYFGGWGDAQDGGYPEAIKPTTTDGYPGTASREEKKDKVVVQFGLCVRATSPFAIIKNYDNYLNPDGTPGYAALSEEAKGEHNRCLTRGAKFVFDEGDKGPPKEHAKPRSPPRSPMKQAKLLHLMAYGAPNQPSRGPFLNRLELDFHQNMHQGLRGDMLKGGSPADAIFWSHHAMLDNIWANWQAKNADNAVEYDITWSYPVVGTTDALNEGFNKGWKLAKGAVDVEIPAGTKRDFSRKHRMVFLAPKFNFVARTDNTRWSIQELMDDERPMYRTLQYTKTQYATVQQPSEHGLNTYNNEPVVFSDDAPYPQ